MKKNNMKLEAKMYVRNIKTGFINKIMIILDDEVLGKILLLDKTPNKYIEYEFDELKASYNIIDLIEVGDYVNGFKVCEIKDNYILVGYKSCSKEINYKSVNYKHPISPKFYEIEECILNIIYTNNIKSIVTKEQFESMAYKIEK